MTNPLLSQAILSAVIPTGTTLPIVLMDSTKRIAKLNATSPGGGGTLLTTDNATQTAPAVVGTRFQAAQNGTFPASSPQIVPNCIYYVVSVAGGNIELSNKPGGAPMTFTTVQNFYLFEPQPIITGGRCGKCLNSIATMEDAVRLEIDDYGCLATRPTYTFTAPPTITTPQGGAKSEVTACFDLPDNQVTILNKVAGMNCASINFDTWGFAVDGSCPLVAGSTTPGDTTGFFLDKGFYPGGQQIAQNSEFKISFQMCRSF